MVNCILKGKYWNHLTWNGVEDNDNNRSSFHNVSRMDNVILDTTDEFLQYNDIRPLISFKFHM